MSGAMDPTAALKARLSAMPGHLERELGAALDEAGNALATEARRRLGAGSGPGRSEPGAAPRDASHRLAEAISVRDRATTPGVTVAVASPVARFLEYGTSRMAARPFLRPAADAVRAGVQARCRAALASAVRRRGGGP